MSRSAVTRITHSCHLIEIGGRTFLTDPWFSTRPGYYQGEPIAVGIADLPRLDGVLITHEHYDHCDLEAFKGFLGDRLITSSDKNPLHYQDASRDLAPETSVRITEPGTRVEL